MHKLIFLVLILLAHFSAQAQYIEVPDSGGKVGASVGVAAGVTSNNTVPFWMRSNQFGSVPVKGLSTSLFVDLYRDYLVENKGLIDWGGGMDIRGNLGGKSNLTIVEAYVKGRLGFVQLKAGRSRDQDGLVDSTLSVGSFSMSGNSLGIPKVELSVPSYTPLPFTSKLLSFKTSFSYGWMGDVRYQFEKVSGDLVPTKFHHFSGSVMFGKPSWRLKLYGAVNHDVTWGADKQIFGNQYHLSDLKAFFYVVTGKKYIGAADISKIGNHLGSLDLATDYQFSNFNVRLYHQFFYDKGALVYLANIRDGLTGIALTNNRPKESDTFDWRKILLEFFYSADQAGQEGAKKTPSGPEYYYNHAVYIDGYSYKGLGIGTPLVTMAKDAKAGQVSDPLNYFINNRVIAFNVGFVGSVSNIEFKFKSTFSRNLGEFRTSGPAYQWFNNVLIKQGNRTRDFVPVNQLSTYIEGDYKLKKKGYSVGAVLASDYGNLLNKSIGVMVNIRRTW